MDADELVRRLSALLGRPPPLRSVADADGPAFAQVLMVCMGNVCRSPMARAVTQTTAQRAAPGDGAGTDPRQAAFFDAAGTHADPAGERLDSRARAALLRRGYGVDDLRHGP